MTATLLVTITLAALLSTLLYVILKFFQRWNINNLHGLTFNYLSAATLAFLHDYRHNLRILEQARDFLFAAVIIGLLFILVFYVTAITAQKSGIAVTSIAGKMSMVIPILAGIYLYHESVNSIKITGIVIAILAVILSNVKRNEEDGKNDTGNTNAARWLLPVLLFVGSGLVDTSIKVSEHYFITPENEGLYLCCLFGSAGAIGLLTIFYQWRLKGITVQKNSIGGGILLGITNYYSLDFLIRALATPGAESSAVFAISNVMVVLMSAFFAILLFRERLNRMNITGLFLSILSIYILTR